ncbi:hypothetical protein [Parabacteroides bouchesdurhonensis]|uniref:hypothetical protein n=1 Tax=Parabacteroides bouchesdurhonensis TaxID=1936995 RepID=UPI0018FF07E8|nr:hypothetical protein [Parabacteroides bouchesdurhonensis]
MNNRKLSVKWLYTFIAIAIIALGTGIASLYYKEYLIAGCMGLVFIAQVINIIKWKK